MAHKSYGWCPKLARLGVRGLDPVKTHVTRPPRIFVELWEIGGLRPEKKVRFFLCRGKLLIELAFSAGSRTFALVSRGFETGLLTQESVEKKTSKRSSHRG